MSQTINDDLIVTGNTTVNGSLIVDGGLQVTDLHVDRLTGGVELTGDLAVPGNLVVESTTPSTSYQTGAATISGGLGVTENINSNGNIKGINIEATTQVKGNTIVSTTSVSAATINATTSVNTSTITASTQLNTPVVNATTSVTTPTATITNANITNITGILTFNSKPIKTLFYPPVGFVYFQGPNDASPEQLWPEVQGVIWDVVSSEEAGLFRRIEGNWQSAGINVSAAFGGVQNDTVQQHGHSTDAKTGTTNVSYGSGETRKSATAAASVSNVSGGRTSLETRPANITIRKWRRTA